jgi:hypothetical protein
MSASSARAPAALPGLKEAIRPEVELLLCCARTHIAPANARRIKDLIGQELDWDYILEQGLQHRVLPLLYFNLSALYANEARSGSTHSSGSDLEAIPQDVFESLQNHYHANARRNLLLTGHLLKLLKLLEIQGIAAVPYKGPTQAAFIYGDLSLRQFRDLDIFVSRRDTPKARDLLISQGYHLSSPDGEAKSEEFESGYSYHYCLMHEAHQVVVELHWAMQADQFSVPLDLSGLRQRPLSLLGTKVHGFLPEELLLILAVHGSRHLWMRLHWLCDIAELIRRHQEIDWETVLSQAKVLGIQRMLYLSLYLSRDLLDAPLPENVWRKMQVDPELKPLAEQISQQFLGGFKTLPSRDVHFYYLKMRERMRDKARYLFFLILLPNESEWKFLRLPPRLRFLYLLMRPLRLLGKYSFNSF